MKYLMRLIHDDIPPMYHYTATFPSATEIYKWFQTDNKITQIQVIPLLNFLTLQYVKEKLRSM